jgi:peptide-methionine (S)-S-oxide reductase
LKHYPIKENKGILKTAVGYTGGNENSKDPDYRTVCSGTTNHAEALRIEFDPSIVKYDELVGEWSRKQKCVYLCPDADAEFFYRTHDPTTVNRQGADTGTRMSL